jgi:hypothetical protein
LIEKYDTGREKMAIFLNYVTNPNYFDSSLMTSEFRASCLPKLDKIKAKIENMDVHPSLLVSCDTIHAWANKPQINDNTKVAKAFDFISRSDKYRKRNIKDYIPEVWEELTKLVNKE